MPDRDFSKCDVCGTDLGPDKMHIVIDNGRLMRHVYAHRRHRYVRVEVRGLGYAPTYQTQMRTDSEIENLRFALMDGKLAVGWE